MYHGFMSEETPERKLRFSGPITPGTVAPGTVVFSDEDPKPWPPVMVLALVVGALSVIALAAVAGWLFDVDLSNPDSEWFGFDILFGTIVLIPAIGGAIGLVAVFRRSRIGRGMYTVLPVLWPFMLGVLWFVMGPYIVVQSAGLVLSAILMWLPGNKPYFAWQDRREARAAQARNHPSAAG